VKQNLEPARGIGAFRSLCSLQVGHSPFQCSCSSHFKTGLSSIPRNPALLKIGAGERNRTPDKLITNQLLYQLSYAGPIIVLPGVASRPPKPPAVSLCEAKRQGRRRKLRRPNNSSTRCSVPSSEAQTLISESKGEGGSYAGELANCIWLIVNRRILPVHLLKCLG
jgi:hypothetical protein